MLAKKHKNTKLQMSTNQNEKNKVTGNRMAVSNSLSLQSLTKVVENWGTTQSKLHKINFTWTIHNFSFLQTDCYYSPSFSGGENDNLKWCLQLYPKHEANNSVYVMVYIKLLSRAGRLDKSIVPCKYKLSILNAIGNKCNEKKSLEVIEFAVNSTSGFSDFIKRHTLLNESNDLLPEDILTLFCTIELVTNKVDFSGRKSTGQIKVPENSLGDDFGHLLQSQMFSDVTLVIGEQQFQAHKAILGARSDVFAAMFQHEMKEYKSGQVIITDVKPEVLQEMLQFIYTGDSPKMEEMADELLVAADKYAVQKLKTMCELALHGKLTTETAAETLILADRHSVDQLKKETINFINIHAKDIIQTKGWAEMLVTHPALIKETLEAHFGVDPMEEQLSNSE